MKSSLARHLARFAGALIVTLGVAGSAVSAEGGSRDGVLGLLPDDQTGQHVLALPARGNDPARNLVYESRVGTLALLGGRGEETAQIFHVGYTVPDAGPDRPVTFVFNGGPGAASAYLHIGALGPRVIEMSPDGAFLPPPPRLVGNPDTWLTLTDLVFVDPVGTGYSRAVEGGDEKRFWRVEQDASAMAAFIRLWLLENDRTASPVYLAGESYGGFRAAVLARVLQEEAGVSPSGLVLISPALEFFLVYPDEFNPLPDALQLPALAASRMMLDGIVDRDELAERLEPVEDYALGPYLSAIARGLDFGRKVASDEVARLTGLPLDLVRRYDARIPVEVFVKETGREARRLYSLYDAVVAGPDLTPQSASPRTPDAVLDRSVPMLTQAIVDYLADELGYRTRMSYRLLNRQVSRHWDFGGGDRQGYAGALGDLQEARALNPDLRVLIAHGYTDLVTPYFVADYLVGQLPQLDDAQPIRLENYAGGHMMYFRPRSRAALVEDAEWVYEGVAGLASSSGPVVPAVPQDDRPAPMP